ncbi:MAG: endonuclease/exonuclease/phosphatase family protein [Treponemataceae bacterium]|nr:endonuclease/exonuclease/phosphatase family protein [Treponemataceae bacterium]
MKANSIFILFFFTCLVFSCTSPALKQENTDSASVKVASWNLQTFFDCQYSGNEYTGFRAQDKNWTVEKYYSRIEKLCRVLKDIDADIFALEEIENKNIIYDIANNYEFQGRRDKAYDYACFAGEENQAFGLAIISRHPILDCTVHQIDIRSEEEEQPSMRPLLNAKILVNDKVLSFYVCHWKSKSSGQEESEKWRLYQEKLLTEIACQDQNPIFICGDFNKDLYEFNIEEKNSTRKICMKSDENSISFNCCWFLLGNEEELEDEGSYYYKNKWEKIDHFFYDDKIKISNFTAVKYSENVKEGGFPYRYSVWKGTGYSDHLPIECILSF